MGSKKKVIIIGLDCLTPQLAFDQYRSSMPTLDGLLKKSLWGRMRSTMPPITCPAWACMVTGKDPGELGIYGFRNRKNHSYTEFRISTSLAVKEKAIWDILGAKGKRCAAIAVPPSFPCKPINGMMVSCFLAPSTDTEYTYPPLLKKDIKKEFGEYLLDVRDFRTDSKKKLLKDIYELTDNRFAAAEYFFKKEPWDLFMFVDMGPDRFHHGFWKYCDPTHQKYRKNNPFENAMRDYYTHLDKKIAGILHYADEDTVVMIVSDHGAKKIDGCFAVNEWLIKQGYLTLKKYPSEQVTIKPDMVDWVNTQCWGEGGYYGRIFFNVKGREPQGVIPKAKVADFAKKLTKELKAVKFPRLSQSNTVIKRPEELYKKVNGIAPDLLVFWKDMDWRSSGKVGTKQIFLDENDTGPDDANHDYQGIFVMAHDGIKKGRELKNISIYDVAPTVLHHMGVKPPKGMGGKVVG